MIKVLIVEDSAVVRDFLYHILDSDPEIRIIGSVKNGEEALKFLEQKKPDIITMDINMPKLDGLETTRRIMNTKPVPIIIVSASVGNNEREKSFQAIEAGALAVVKRPAGFGHPAHDSTSSELLQSIKLMSEVRLITRRKRKKIIKDTSSFPGERKPGGRSRDLKIVAIGASFLFRSVGNEYGRDAIGILLSGMGKDGADELKMMKEKGAITIVQDRASSVVYGMPGEAVKLKAETYVLTPDEIITMLVEVAKNGDVEIKNNISI